ncbi:MAG: hypothetical protein RLN75_08240 [Longimicrobiales bacterium]
MMSEFRTLTALTGALLLVACGGDAPEADMAVEAGPAAESAAEDMGDATATDGLLNPNEASEAELMEVPGMSSAVVAAVIEGRPWADMLAVDAALAEAGLDEAAREEAYRVMFLPLDLNNASEAEILLIPGVDGRMAYEFDEYRPYDAMDRFREEIGKYVDEDEVARLEQYVEIR